MRKSGLRFVGSVASATLLMAMVPEVAGGGIASGSGNIQVIAPPASVLNGATEHATDVLAFSERQGVTLASGIRTDIQTPGIYDQTSDLTTMTIPAGTVVDSHYLQSDRAVGGTTLRQFTITFTTDILGVVVTAGKLGDSDVLGAPGTVYGGTDRGLGFAGGAQTDIVVLSDQRTMQGTWQTTTGVDSVRVITEHNSSPVVAAGGPYAGVEGAPIAMSGTALDPDGDALTKLWSATWVGDAGTSCVLSGATTLTPSIDCTDDALVTATLSVSDGVNPAVVASAQITVGNVVPSSSALGVPSGAVPLGSSAAVSVTFVDVGINDTHSATISWGDTTSSAGAISESAGAGTATASHTYALAGLYTASLTLSDDDNGSVVSTAQILVNGPPAADAGGPYSGSEGLPTALGGSAIDPEGDPLSVGWTFTPAGIDAGGSCTSAGAATLTPSLTCDDDAVVAASLSADDGISAPVVSSTVVAVANEAPMLGAVAATIGPIATGAPVSVLAPFTDDGTNDTHTATVAWGDLTSSNAAISEVNGSGTLTATHVYSTPGIYTITVTVDDDDLGSASETASVVVNSRPVIAAGGPYVGLEGAALALSGTATDPDGDALAISWTFSVVGDPGTVCTPVGAGTLTPTLTCNDDAIVTATLTASDGVNAAVTDTATITVGNAQPLSTGAVGSASIAPNGSTVSVGLTFSDAGTNDSHSATIDWGDTTVIAANVTSSGGTGAVSGEHIYTVSGTYTITVTLTDDDGAITIQTTSVVINGAPDAGAGGPYAGVEGAPVTLNGTAADPDIDVLAISWSRAIVTADAGTACVLVGATTLTPTLTCDDDALVDVTISVADGVNPVVIDTVRVTIANGNPSVAAPTVVPNPVPLGAPVSLTAAFTDPGVNDNHTATIQWGDATSNAATVSEIPGSGTVAGGHTYAAPGTYAAKVIVNDKDGGTHNATVSVVVNAPPTVDAAGPFAGVEGVPLALGGTADDPDGDPLSLEWSFVVVTDAGGSCTMSGTATLVPSILCSDDSTITATLTASDGVNAAVTDTAVVTIANQASGIGLVTVPATPVPVGTSITALTTFVDPGTNDTHTATVSWGDTLSSAGTVNEASGNGSVSATHSYAAAGTYTVIVTIVDDDTGTVIGTASSPVTVFSSSNGFVTGGGWITSPSGAYTPNNPNDANLVGRATFGFVAHKLPSDPLPTGSTEFQLRLRSPGNDDDDNCRCRDDRRDDGWSRTPNFNFKSTGYQTLVVTDTNTKAYYNGTGKVNGTSGYSFLVSVIDGRTTHTADRFRIKVWNTTTGEVVYDNLAGAADDASATTQLSGGSIVIH
jgi:PKD repeat protein